MSDSSARTDKSQVLKRTAACETMTSVCNLRKHFPSNSTKRFRKRPLSTLRDARPASSVLTAQIIASSSPSPTEFPVCAIARSSPSRPYIRPLKALAHCFCSCCCNLERVGTPEGKAGQTSLLTPCERRRRPLQLLLRLHLGPDRLADLTANARGIDATMSASPCLHPKFEANPLFELTRGQAACSHPARSTSHLCAREAKRAPR